MKSDEFSSYLCRSCAKKISNVVSKIKELKSLFEESEQVWKCTERIKRGCKNKESPPQSQLAKKPMTLTPPKSKLSLTSRFQSIAPKATYGHNCRYHLADDNIDHTDHQRESCTQLFTSNQVNKGQTKATRKTYAT